MTNNGHHQDCDMQSVAHETILCSELCQYFGTSKAESLQLANIGFHYAKPYNSLNYITG